MNNWNTTSLQALGYEFRDGCWRKRQGEKLEVAGVGKVEVSEEALAKWEREIHGKFANWLMHHTDEVYFDRSRSDKRTRNRKGHPDFMLAAFGSVLFIEFKMPGRKPDADQERVHAWIKDAGGHVFVLHSALDAINLTVSWLKALRGQQKPPSRIIE